MQLGGCHALGAGVVREWGPQLFPGLAPAHRGLRTPRPACSRRGRRAFSTLTESAAGRDGRSRDCWTDVVPQQIRRSVACSLSVQRPTVASSRAVSSPRRQISSSRTSPAVATAQNPSVRSTAFGGGFRPNAAHCRYDMNRRQACRLHPWSIRVVCHLLHDFSAVTSWALLRRNEPIEAQAAAISQVLRSRDAPSVHNLACWRRHGLAERRRRKHDKA